jgi:hypothetical protein
MPFTGSIAGPGETGLSGAWQELRTSGFRFPSRQKKRALSTPDELTWVGLRCANAVLIWAGKSLNVR